MWLIYILICFKCQNHPKQDGTLKTMFKHYGISTPMSTVHYPKILDASDSFNHIVPKLICSSLSGIGTDKSKGLWNESSHHTWQAKWLPMVLICLSALWSYMFEIPVNSHGFHWGKASRPTATVLPVSLRLQMFSSGLLYLARCSPCQVLEARKGTTIWIMNSWRLHILWPDRCCSTIVQPAVWQTWHLQTLAVTIIRTWQTSAGLPPCLRSKVWWHKVKHELFSRVCHIILLEFQRFFVDIYIYLPPGCLSIHGRYGVYQNLVVGGQP